MKDADETKVHPALAQHFGYCLSRAAGKLRWLLNDRLSQFGLIAQQLGILFVLVDIKSISQVVLGQEMGIDKATMVKLLDQLEYLKLVERVAHGNDRRVKLVRLTPFGRKRLFQIRKVCKNVETKFLKPLTQQEQSILRKILPKLL